MRAAHVCVGVAGAGGGGTVLSDGDTLYRSYEGYLDMLPDDDDDDDRCIEVMRLLLHFVAQNGQFHLIECFVVHRTRMNSLTNINL